MKKLLLILPFLLLALFVKAQQPDTVKLNKAIEVFNQGDYMKGIKMVRKVIDKTPTSETWDLLVAMYMQRYKYSLDQTPDLMAALLGEKKKTNKGESPVTCLTELILACREAALYSESPTASQYLRNWFVDYQPDSVVPIMAKDQFDSAEQEFTAKDYATAIVHYKKAMQMHPNYYKATLYAGDAYWAKASQDPQQKGMDSAIYYYKAGLNMHPDLLEPHKYMADALAATKHYDEAEEECITAIEIYPDQIMFTKLHDILAEGNKTFDKHWLKRGCEINRVGVTADKAKDQAWKVYQSAKDDIQSYCDSNGVIVKPTNLTTQKYLEVYSFEKMLNDKSLKLPADFDFAKKAQKDGYLDCYVFVSNFNIDMYAQYKDFVKHNKDRIKTYLESYLVQK